MAHVRFLPGLLALLALGPGCRSADKDAGDASAVKFDGPFSAGLDATISQGTIYTHADYRTPSLVEDEIRAQLQFTVGQLNGLGGVSDMTRLSISAHLPPDQEAPAEGWTVTYAASFFVSWPKEVMAPPTLTLILPRSGDPASRSAFFNAYRAPCSDDPSESTEYSIFWYHYRPAKSGCPLNDSAFDRSLVSHTRMDLRPSDLQTAGKFPEYGKIWEDGKLVVTVLFGQFKAQEPPAADDAGMAAFNEMYHYLRLSFGTPVSATQVYAEDDPKVAPAVRDIEMTWNIAGKGQLNIRMFLIQDIQGAALDPAFRAAYEARTLISDLITYSGHSDLGQNIRTLANIGKFTAGQYQIFLINGCDTFAYVDDALWDAHASLNPGAGPHKYLDIVTNAMPSFFSNNTRSNLALIGGLVEAKRTYREILTDFDQSQRAVVTGEEDNTWPGPFLAPAVASPAEP